jgi:hypothetical protein
LRHDVVVHVILPHVVTNIVSGYFDVFKYGWHLGKRKDRYVHQYLVDPFFRKCNQLNEDTFEVEMSKKTITLDLPMQIGCFVYQYAKLRMLEFYYDFMDVFAFRNWGTSILQLWKKLTSW